MAYNVLDDLTPENLHSLLKDTQASLATSLARIEAYRIENKLLANEASQLRSSVFGSEVSDQPGPAPASASSTAADGGGQLSDGSLSTRVQRWSSVNSGPVEVSDLKGQHPIEIVNGVKKEPAQLLITRDYIEIVSSKGTMRAHEFVGIAKVKGNSEGSSGRASEHAERGRWQMIWNQDNQAQRLVFEASKLTKDALKLHTDRWLGLQDAESLAGVIAGDAGECVPPQHLILGEANLEMVGPPSEIINLLQARALASAVPPLERMRSWSLSYSTTRHGISLSTLYRRQNDRSPTITLIKDSGGHVFGAYTPDSWKINPRFYGSGETFVFQLEPHMIYYPWRSLSSVKNEYFLYATPECLAVGGLGHFSIHIDSELLQGSSGACGTFGSPCLACKEDFKVMLVEVWQAV